MYTQPWNRPYITTSNHGPHPTGEGILQRFRSFQIDRWAQLLVLVSVHVCDCDVCVQCVHCELAYVCVQALVGVVCGLVFMCIMVDVCTGVFG